MNRLAKGLVVAAVTLAVSVSIGAVSLIATSTVSAADDDSPNLVQRVAQILGIGEEDLSEAFKEAQKAEIDERVAEGKLDAEKAEEIKQKIDESDHLFPGMGKMREMRGRRHGRREEHKGALAEFLGISVEELEQAREDGRTIEDLLEDAGKTKDELKEYMIEKFGERLEECPFFGGEGPCRMMGPMDEESGV